MSSSDLLRGLHGIRLLLVLSMDSRYDRRKAYTFLFKADSVAALGGCQEGLHNKAEGKAVQRWLY